MEAMRRVSVILAAFSVLSLAGVAQPTEPPVPQLEVEVISVVRELQAAMFYAALAVYAPTPADQRLYCQQVVNLIEGEGGEHFVAEGLRRTPGMLNRLAAIHRAVPPDLPPMKRRAVVLVLNNVRTFLELALEESLASLRKEDVEAGAVHMRKAFAFLFAAWGVEVETPYLGGMWLLLKHLGYQRPMPPGRGHP